MNLRTARGESDVGDSPDVASETPSESKVQVTRVEPEGRETEGGDRPARTVIWGEPPKNFLRVHGAPPESWGLYLRGVCCRDYLASWVSLGSSRPLFHRKMVGSSRRNSSWLRRV